MDPLASFAIEPAVLVDYAGPLLAAFVIAAAAIAVGVVLSIGWDCRRALADLAPRAHPRPLHRPSSIR